MAGFRFAAWLAKPPGTDYRDFFSVLEPFVRGPGRSLWQRHMVLGPAPEFCLLAGEPLRLPTGLEPVNVDRDTVWPPAG
ncbi:MAG: hypothetical protein M3R38_28375 [Actinomycetota bacterium]|nr:hypothetical protein [Actinomycetota bacterium]